MDKKRLKQSKNFIDRITPRYPAGTDIEDSLRRALSSYVIESFQTDPYWYKKRQKEIDAISKKVLEDNEIRRQQYEWMHNKEFHNGYGPNASHNDVTMKQVWDRVVDQYLKEEGIRPSFITPTLQKRAKKSK